MIRTIMERFVEHSPAAVMARLVMQWALQPESMSDLLDGEDEDEGGAQRTRETLFSMMAQALPLIEGHTRTANVSWNMPPEFAASVTALHDRMSRAHAQWARALVADSVDALRAASAASGNTPVSTTCGYRLRVLGLPAALGGSDASHQDDDATSKRAAPGAAVVPVYDPELEMIVDLLPCDGQCPRERRLAGPWLKSVRPGELWIADERIDANAVLLNWPCRGGAFLIREHGIGAAYRPREALREQGIHERGIVYEQTIEASDEAGGTACARRIVWQPAATGEEAGSGLSLLTNAPAHQLDAVEAVRLFSTQWSALAPLPIEAVRDDTLFAAVAPRAVLLASGLVALAYNTLSAIIRIVRATLELDAREVARLPLSIAEGTGAAYAGMMIALPPEDWRRYDAFPDSELREILRRLAVHVDPRSERRKRRDQRASATAQARLRAATLERLLRDDGELHAAGPFKPHTIAMATRDFSSNPSRALRYANDALVMVTKYNRPIALLVSIDDWNRLMGEVRQTSLDRLSLACTGYANIDAKATLSECSFN